MTGASTDQLKPAQLERRCPRLGSTVSFNYCREGLDKDLPCNNIFNCWWEMFDVTACLKEMLPEETFDRLIRSKNCGDD